MATKAPKRTWFQSDDEAIEQALADLGGGNFFKPKEGKNIVRILPPYKDNGKFFFEGKFHYGFKSDGKTVTVPYMGEDSYIMKKLNALSSDGEEGMKLSKRYGPRTKFFVNIIDRESGAVKVWGFSSTIMKKLKAFRLDNEDGGKFEDPEEGYDLIIERTGKGMETRYDVRFRPRPSAAIEAGEEIPELFDLEAEAGKDYTVAELKSIWAETFSEEGDKKVASGEDSDVEDDEDEPVSKKSKAKRIDEGDDDEDEEDEVPVKKSKRQTVVEDEEETPAKKSKKRTEEDDEEDEEPVAKSKKKVVEDSDDDDDEEEEIVPAKKKTSSNRSRR